MAGFKEQEKNPEQLDGIIHQMENIPIPLFIYSPNLECVKYYKYCTDCKINHGFPACTRVLSTTV